MATVAVTIAGRTYRMACGEGEESHLQDLARHVDRTMASLRKGFGEIGDQRLVIMTAITVADELSEARQRIDRLEGQLADLAVTTSEGTERRDALAADMVLALDAASERIEHIAQTLNEIAKSPETAKGPEVAKGAAI